MSDSLSAEVRAHLPTGKAQWFVSDHLLKKLVDAYDAIAARQHQSDLNYDALEKQNDALREELEKTKEALRLTGEGRPSEWAYNTPLLNDFRALREQVAEMRKALESIAANSCCQPCREAGLVAREVLEKWGKK